MDKFEKQLKSEFDNLYLPENNMYGRVVKELCSTKTYNRILFRRIAACFLVCVTLLAGSVTIYAGVNDISLSTIFKSIWGTQVDSEIYETVSCRAHVVSESNLIKNLSIKPVRVIGDSRGIYIVLKITGDDFKEDFTNYDVDYSEGGNASVELYEIESDEKERYIALEYIGDGTKGLIADAGLITINLSGYGGKSGNYHTVISYEYIYEEKSLQFENNIMHISSLTVMCELNDRNEYERHINDNLCVIMDKEKVDLKFCYGVETKAHKYRIVYSLSQPVYPNRVTAVERSGDND